MLIIAAVLSACGGSVKPIEYGQDECFYCSMSIVENQYGAELVTDKGKVRKFDAIECMVKFIRKNPDLEFSATVVNVFDKPGELIDAMSCSYLITRALPSPMGAYLTAFSSREKALQMQEKKMGEVFTWEEIMTHKKI